LVAHVVPRGGWDRWWHCSEREPPGRNVHHGEAPSSMPLRTSWVLLSTRRLL
jgi:hypothetical protein